MCRRVSCSKCGRPTWAGCGAHVEQVLGNVPKDDRCRCREEKAAAGGAAGGKTTDLLRKGVIAIGIALVAWFAFGRASGDTTGSEARALVEQGAQLVDVRTPAEFAEGHVPGAVNIPVDEIERRAGEIEKDEPVVLYCRSGARSSRAAGILEAAGYEHVHDLGPMSNW